MYFTYKMSFSENYVLIGVSDNLNQATEVFQKILKKEYNLVLKTVEVVMYDKKFAPAHQKAKVLKQEEARYETDD